MNTGLDQLMDLMSLVLFGGGFHATDGGEKCWGTLEECINGQTGTRNRKMIFLIKVSYASVSKIHPGKF